MEEQLKLCSELKDVSFSPITSWRVKSICFEQKIPTTPSGASAPDVLVLDPSLLDEVVEGLISGQR